MKPWWLRPFGDREEEPPAAGEAPGEEKERAGAKAPSKEKGPPKGKAASKGKAPSKEKGPPKGKPPSEEKAPSKGKAQDAGKDEGKGTGKRKGKEERERRPGGEGKPPEEQKAGEGSGKEAGEGKTPREGRSRGGRGRRRGAQEARNQEGEERSGRERPGGRRGQRRWEEVPPAGGDNGLRGEVPPASASERNGSVNDERKIALFCDLENIALGVRDSAEVKKFDINLVLERLLEKGKIIVKKAYCDWERYNDFKRAFHEAAIELIDIPQKYYSGKNSADIKMVVDAMDLCYSKEHLDTFVILSGDSDFSPLVSKLKENNKYVIGVGVKGASSNLLIGNCDEFIYYEDVWRSQQQAPKLDGLPKKTAECFGLMTDAIQALVRENKDVLWGSMIKQTMQRKKPSFNEGYYGYSTFSELLEDAEDKNVIKLKKDQRSGSYVVTGFAGKR